MEKIEEIIKEIAVKHGIAIGRDDPILILNTLNERLLKETADAQRQIMHEFREELESAAHEWETTAKNIAEKIFNAALTASNETLKKAITEGGKTAAEVFGREVDSKLVQICTAMRISRLSAIVNLVAVVMTVLAAAGTLWVIK
jgi:Transcriptional activator TraM